MDNEIVLFLQERVPPPELHAALGELFRLAPDAADTVVVVDYPQGFATGISIPCTGAPTHGAIRKLAARMHTAVLLESWSREHEESQWLLFVPGRSRPHSVQVIELRHGLDVVERVPRTRHFARLAYA